MVGDATVDGYESYEDAIAAQPAEPLADRVAGRDMLYSSGTTGRPKGIKTAAASDPVDTPSAVTGLGLLLFGFGPDTIYLSPAPLYHSAPLRFTMAVHQVGGTVVVMEHFDASEALALIERYRVTTSQWVPTMFMRLLKLPADVRAGFDVSSLEVAIHAAAPCPVEVKRQMIEWWGPVLHEYYAGTEGNGFVYTNSEDWLAHPGTVGRNLTGEIHIVGDDGDECPIGEPGTIWFAGTAEFEYHNDPDKTAESRDERGWTTLGDVGRLDDDGFLYLTDRKSYMIISGGVNIYPQETENLLTVHPAVFDVAVIGVPNEDFGEEVKAVVQVADGATAGAGSRARADRLLPPAPGRRQVPAVRRLRGRAAAAPHREALQAAAPRPVLGWSRLVDHLMLAFLDHPGPIPFAHRGGAGAWPENTMPAFAGAVALGYRYVETDVHVTADGVLCAFHDERLDRVTDRVGLIRELPWAEVSRARVDGTEPIPLLTDLLEAWPDLRVNIDPKHDSAVDALADTLRRTNSVERVCIGAFSDRRLARLRALLGPTLCTSLGPGGVARLRAASFGPPSGALPAACVQVPPNQGRVTLVDERFLRAAHERSMPVHIWTIDDPTEMGRLLDLGVDGIMTDEPAVLKAVLESRGQWY